MLTGLSAPTLAAAGMLHQQVSGTGTIGGSNYVSLKTVDQSLQAKSANPDAQLKNGIMPDLRGMNATDAVFLLENYGIRVKIKGVGAVINQSVAPGEKIPATREVFLELSI